MSVPGEKIALFIDGANLYATAKSLGFDIDYKRLLREFQSRGYLLRAFYYTAVIEDQEYSSIRPLIDWLDYNGYTVVTKATKEFVDQTGRRKVKGNMDIELAVDAMEIARHDRPYGAVFRRRRFPLAGRGRAAARRARHRRLDHRDPTADGRRRAAPAGGHLPRHRRAAAARSAATRPSAPRGSATARAAGAQHTPQFLQRPAAPQRAGAGAEDDDDEIRRRAPRNVGMRQAETRPRLPALPASCRVPRSWRAARAGLVQRAGPLVRPADARLLIVGLAPGLRGANRTGRPFTGDYAGDLLYGTLERFGFARGDFQARPDDGLDTGRCPHHQRGALRAAGKQADAGGDQHLPRFPRRDHCGDAQSARHRGARPHRARDHGEGARRKALGRPVQPWRHAHESAAGLFASYHCSRYNTNTGVLTPEMFRAVFAAVRRSRG